MAFERIGILSIGEMGFHWADLLKNNNVPVFTFDKNRSDTTRQRAANAGVTSVPTLSDLVSETDLIVSLVIPTAAAQVASSLAATLQDVNKKEVCFLDANAISPMTAQKIKNIFGTLQLTYIDGCIIGSSAKLTKDTIIYVSGPQAEKIEQLSQYGFTVRTLGEDIGQASAFKIIYAGLTKGLQGLLVELLVGAKSLNLLDPLIECYEERLPGLVKKVGRGIAALPVHAGRRAEEMDELEQTFQHYGLISEMAPATRKVLNTIAALNIGKASENGVRKGTLLETLQLFVDNGLLKK